MPASSAEAQKRTPLLKVDMEKGKATFRIDPPEAEDDDDDLSFLGITRKGFTTKELDRVEKALRQSIRSRRPRAAPRLLLFLHPGKVSRQGLKDLFEVTIDLQLEIDPCARSVCRDAVARVVQLVGKALGEEKQKREGYTVVFREVTIKALTEYKGKEVRVYRLNAGQCIEASQSYAKAQALITGFDRQEEQYEKIMTKAIARNARKRRIKLRGAPDVRRDKGSVSVSLGIKSSRNRYKSEVLDALTAAGKALRSSSVTPADYAIDVAAAIKFRKVETRRFHCPGSAMSMYLKDEISSSALWSRYISEQAPEGAAVMGFSEAEERAPSIVSSSGPSEEEIHAVVAEDFAGLQACIVAELKRKPALKGVTFTFTLNGNGRASKVGVKEKRRVSKKLVGCAAKAFSRIRFPRFNGLPRGVKYPVFVRG